MNPWIIIGLVTAGIVFLADLIIRRKGWKSSTKAEKTSLILHMISVPLYVFLSALGMLWGIVGGRPDNAFGAVLYDVTLTMAFYYFIVAVLATISSFVLRTMGKTKASIWTNVIGLAYIFVVLTVNYLAGALF